MSVYELIEDEFVLQYPTDDDELVEYVESAAPHMPDGCDLIWKKIAGVKCVGFRRPSGESTMMALRHDVLGSGLYPSPHKIGQQLLRVEKLSRERRGL